MKPRIWTLAEWNKAHPLDPVGQDMIRCTPSDGDTPPKLTRSRPPQMPQDGPADPPVTPRSPKAARRNPGAS
jgi:hypothetical protein